MAKHNYTCSDLVIVNSSGSTSSCTGSTLIFTASGTSGAYVTDGTYNGAPTSGFTITNGATYYVTLTSPSGGGSADTAIDLHNSTADSTIYNWIGGAGAQTFTIVAPASGSNTQLHLNNNLNGDGTSRAGVLTDICISSVSHADCLGTSDDFATSTATTQDVVLGLGIIITILCIMVVAMIFNSVKKPWA